MLYARRKLAAFSGLCISGIAFIVVLSPVYFLTDLSNKVLVGHGNPRFVPHRRRMALARLLALGFAGPALTPTEAAGKLPVHYRIELRPDLDRAMIAGFAGPNRVGAFAEA